MALYTAICTYGNVDTLQQTLNAVAAVMNNADYLSLIRIVALVAFIATALVSAFANRVSVFHWFIGFVIVYYSMFAVKTSVWIFDKLNYQPLVLVNNVPIGVAYPAYFANVIGVWLTESFEATFNTLDDELKYEKNGMMFGTSMLADTRNYQVINAQFRKDLNEFVRSCTMYDVVEGRIPLEELKTSTNLWTTMGSTSAGRMLMLGSPQTLMSCQAAYTNYLSPLLNDAIDKAVTFYAKQRYPLASNDAFARSLLLTQMPVAYQAMLNVTMTGQDIISQNFMINLMNDSGFLMSQELNDPAMAQIALATAQTQAVQNTTYHTMAKVAESSLPKIRNAIEIIIIAIFPVVFLTFLLPLKSAAMAIKGYIYTLVWIQLWPPLYAVLNMIMTIIAQRKLTALSLADPTNPGLSLATAFDIGNTSLSESAIAGYLVLSIPFIAMAIIKGADSLMTSVVSSVMRPAESSGGAAAHAVATGNLSYGNFSYGNSSSYNTNAFKHSTDLAVSDSGMGTYTSAGGRQTYNGSGWTSMQANTPILPIAATVGAKLVNSFNQRSSEQYAHAGEQLINYMRENRNGQREALSWSINRSDADKTLNTIRTDVQNSFRTSDGHKLSNDQVDQVLVGAMVGLGTPGGDKSPLSARVQGQLQSISKDSEQLHKSLEAVRNTLRSRGISTEKALANIFENSSAFQEELSKGNTRLASASQSFREARAFDQAAELSTQVAAGADVNLNKRLQDAIFAIPGTTLEKVVQNPDDPRYRDAAEQVIRQTAEQMVNERYNSGEMRPIQSQYMEPPSVSQQDAAARSRAVNTGVDTQIKGPSNKTKATVVTTLEAAEQRTKQDRDKQAGDSKNVITGITNVTAKTDKGVPKAGDQGPTHWGETGRAWDGAKDILNELDKK